MQLHIHLHGEGHATKESAPSKGARSKLKQAIQHQSKAARARAQRRLTDALAANVSDGNLRFSVAYELLQRAHYESK
jgi:hypothetical protein